MRKQDDSLQMPTPRRATGILWPSVDTRRKSGFEGQGRQARDTHTRRPGRNAVVRAKSGRDGPARQGLYRGGKVSLADSVTPGFSPDTPTGSHLCEAPLTPAAHLFQECESGEVELKCENIIDCHYLTLVHHLCNAIQVLSMYLNLVSIMI